MIEKKSAHKNSVEEHFQQPIKKLNKRFEKLLGKNCLIDHNGYWANKQDIISKKEEFNTMFIKIILSFLISPS